MGKGKNKPKAQSGCKPVRKEDQYWIQDKCGYCGKLAIDTKYHHLHDDGGRMPYCDAYCATAHHEKGYA